MQPRFNRLARFIPSALLALALAAPASAQVFTGRIDVTVEDSTGGRLPGVNVELSGPASQSQVTDARGQAHFLSLPVGTYTVKTDLAGFNPYTNSQVVVEAGAATPLLAKLGVAGTAETVNVSAATPIIDTRKSANSTTISLDELQNIPSGRDPWVVLQTVPGIIVDRVNVGGSESGQQSGYQAKGASGADATWNLDGVPITDMAATGSTPTYYDFDMFQEMNVTTGGSDMSSSTGGVHLSLVLKSGQNTPHGSTRYYYENESLQSNNMDPTLARNLGSPNGKGNRTVYYKDYGFELGGPIVKDRLWGWGSIGKTNPKILTIIQTPDETILKNYAFKTQGQVTPGVRGSFTYYHGLKEKFGRSASATRPPETTWNQGSLGRGFFKGEGNFVVGNNLFLTARGSHHGTGFFLTPQGGLNAQMIQDDTGTWHGSYLDYRSERPDDSFAGDGSYFAGKNELKFGYAYRKVEVHSATTYPGNAIISYGNGYPNMIAELDPPNFINATAKYNSAWLSDTISLNRATVNLGVRFDHLANGLPEYSMTGTSIPGFAQYLPDLTSPAKEDVIAQTAVSPRLSVNYSLDESRKTQLRGSYAMFVSQLSSTAASFVAVGQYRYIAFDAVDRNGDRIAQPSEIDFSAGSLQYWNGFDINNPSALSTPNRIGDYSIPKTHEVLVGLDRELRPDFGVGVAFTYRRMVDFNWQPRIGVRSPQYVQAGTFAGGPLPDGSNFSTPYYYVPKAGLSADALSGGKEYITKDGYHQRYVGVEASATKRLSNRWMARFGFSANKHQEFFDNPAVAIQDPTPTVPTAACSTVNGCSPNRDGGLVVTSSGGSGKSNIYQILPSYQFIANGLYQAPLGIDLGFNYTLRQGFGELWHQDRITTPNDAFSARKSLILTGDVGADRLPAVSIFDFRLGKQVKFGRAAANVDFDIFNLFNSDTILGRQYNRRLTGATGFNQVLEIMNPRIARIGVRFSF